MGKIGRILGICAGTALLLTGVSMVANAETPVSAAGPPSPVEERLWYGVAPEEVDELLSILDPQVEEHPDLFGGVALAYDRQSVVLFVADDDYAKLAPEVAALVEENQDIVKTSRVEYSLSSLRALQLEVNESLRGSQMALSQIDVMNNSVKVGVESEAAARGLAATLNYEKREVPLEIETISSMTNLAGRYDDYPRFYMGGAIEDANENWCSLGIPVVVGETRGVLTAGHCTSGTWRTPTGRLVGTTYTTAFPGNARHFGDWKILSGSMYGEYVFNGPADSNSTSTRRLVGVSRRGIGQEVCHSGATTGQVCRYVVVSQGDSGWSDGVEIGHLTVMYHDQNRDGFSDSNGALEGDSGGPVYSQATSNAQDGDMAHGIVNGYYNDWLGRRRYTYTQFDGVTEWNSNVRFGY